MILLYPHIIDHQIWDPKSSPSKMHLTPPPHCGISKICILIPYWVALWFYLCVCSFAIDTSFPLSYFKTKHIFGTLMAVRKLQDQIKIKICGAFGDPNFYFYLFLFYRRQRRQYRRARDTPPNAEYIYIYMVKRYTKN